MSQRSNACLVTGIGALTPLGLSASETWTGLVAGECGIDAVKSFDASGSPVRIAGEVQGFQPEALLGPKRARRTARFSQLAIAAAREAIDDAGLRATGRGTLDPHHHSAHAAGTLDPHHHSPQAAGTLDPHHHSPQAAGTLDPHHHSAHAADAGALDADPSRVGVVINSAIGGVPEAQHNVEALLKGGPKEVSPYYVASTIPNMPACEVAIDLRVHGPVSAGALACASGSAALLEGARLIHSGEADVVIAGGTDAGVSAAMFASLANMGAMSQRNDDPKHASRPFDRERDGFVFGEGAVVVVLEAEQHAKARRARSYGSLAGGALTCDAFHMSAPEPSSQYAAEAIRLALQRSEVTPYELDYICAHGTSTPANDVAETRAIKLALGAAAEHVPASSPKSMVGHLIGAAGALSAVVCLLAMRDSVLPPTINLQHPDPRCDLDYVPLAARTATVRTAALNAFGFGGQNCVLVLRAP